MFGIRTTEAVLGWTPRAGGSAFQPPPFTGSRKRLGETEHTWYARAKAAVAKYDDLSERAGRIADPVYAGGILGRFRPPARDPRGPLYRRNSVAFAVADAESRSPLDFSAFGTADLEKKVEELEGWDREFERAVQSGEESRGIRGLGQAAPAAPREVKGLEWTDCAPWVVGAVVLGGVAVIALSS